MMKAGIAQVVRRFLANRRGSVSLMFALMLVPLVIGMTIAVDMSSMVDARGRLQRAVDNAALSGAASYSVNATSAQTRAVVSATAAFCEMTAAMPNSFMTTGGGSQPCGGANGGPTVTTQIGGFKAGTPGIVASACSASMPVISGGVTCGFIVTVSAQATTASVFSTYLGLSRTVAATGIAANPFINIGNSVSAQIQGSARYTDSVWVYPLLLDSNGNPDFTTNSGAVPGLPTGYSADATPTGCGSLTDCGQIGTAAGLNCTSDPTKCSATPVAGCTDDPLQFVCGAFTMLASTFYNSATNPCPASSPCQPAGAGNYPTIIQGVVQNPQAPAAIITATTPIGIAYQSVAGGGLSYGTGGYQSYPPYGYTSKGCTYPGNTVYTTAAQVYGNAANNITGSTPSNFGLDWPKVTHWFYSSYLLNGLAPSAGEILSQQYPSSYTPPGRSTIYYNTRIPSVGYSSAAGFTPSLATCAALATNGGSYDEFLLTTYPTAGATNGSLFILKQAPTDPYIPPASTGYAGILYTPAGTPGYQYSGLSCQAYGSNVFTFYWNDMGGGQSSGDDKDYNNGTVRITCSPSSNVRLIG